jgi:hypothetical protein
MRIIASVLACLVACPALAQTASYEPPRTPDGHPDFQGVWEQRGYSDLERPDDASKLVLSEAEAKAFHDAVWAKRGGPKQLDPEVAKPDIDSLMMVRGEYRSSLVVEPADGKLPITMTARAYLAGRKSWIKAAADDPEQRGDGERCLGTIGATPLGLGIVSMYRQIVQTPDDLVILSEAQNTLRVVRLGDQSTTSGATFDYGQSHGRWEGDVLVIETTRFPPGFLSAAAGDVLISGGSRVIERFTRVSDDELDYDFTVIDPTLYSAPWRAEMSLTRSTARMYESACHEGNYGLAGILSAARAEDRKTAKADAAKARP